MTLPLAGIKVIDFTHVVSGPLCTRTLALLGAEVIKIEPPRDGDMIRRFGPGAGKAERPPAFTTFNVGKKSLALNLRDPDGIQIAKALIRDADVVVENYRPGVMDKLGLGYGRLKPEHPGLIYCSISGYGQSGPSSHLPAFDNIVQADAGMMTISGFPDDGPIQASFMAADSFSGFLATQAILAALFRRERSGQGDQIDVSMFEAALALMIVPVGSTLVTGNRPKRIGNSAFGIGPGTDVFATSHGYISMAAFTDGHFVSLWRLIGREDLIADERFRTAAARSSAINEARELLQEGFRKKAALEWLQMLQAEGIPASIVRELPEALAEPYLKERGFIREVEAFEGGSDVSTIGVGYRFDGCEASPLSAPPAIGEHTDEILMGSGFSAEQIRSFRESGAVA